MMAESPRQPDDLLEDLILNCCDCGADFYFTAGEQRYFSAKKLSPPKRCPHCRAERKRNLIPDSEARHD